jgi:hypothetical protein
MLDILCQLVAAVQQERKPPELKEARSGPAVIGQSGQRIYFNKDLESPSSSASTFAEKSEVCECAKPHCSTKICFLTATSVRLHTGV